MNAIHEWVRYKLDLLCHWQHNGHDVSSETFYKDCVGNYKQFWLIKESTDTLENEQGREKIICGTHYTQQVSLIRENTLFGVEYHLQKLTSSDSIKNELEQE